MCEVVNAVQEALWLYATMGIDLFVITATATATDTDTAFHHPSSVDLMTMSISVYRANMIGLV